MNKINTYLQSAFQPSRKLGQHHTRLLSHRHVRLSHADQDPSGLDQIRHLLPIQHEPRLVLDPTHAGGAREQVRGQDALILVRQHLPLEIETLDEGLTLARVVLLEAQPKQGRLDAGEASAEILRAGEGQSQDEVRVVIFLPLRVQQGRPGSVGREREILVEQRLDVRRRLGGGLVAEGTRFEFGQY